MPIYEFECQACRMKFDHLARTMSGAPVAACPKCGSDQTRRALSVFAVASESGSAPAGEAGPMCGCGRRPGSCGMD